MDFNLNLAIGIFGALIQLIAFALNLYNKMRNNSAYYVGTNVFGALCTSYYAIVNSDIPFLLLEATWGFFALLKLAEVLRKKKK